jgi:hypothetical protein
MPRTTIDIDPAVLQELERRKRVEGKTLGRLVSELLAVALRQPPSERALEWTSLPMRGKVDLDDKEALRRALDES